MKEQRKRALRIHQQMLANQQQRYKNRFTSNDGDCCDQQEIRDKLDAANRKREQVS